MLAAFEDQCAVFLSCVLVILSVMFIHEQQNGSKNEPIRAEAITEAHQCLVSASSPNMGGYKHFQLI